MAREEEPVAEKPNPILAGDELVEYLRVAKSIGFMENGALLEQRLRTFFEDNGISVYPAEKVQAYLDNKFGKAECWDATWRWRALRPEDAAKGFNGRVLNQNGGIFERGCYHGKVPLAAALTVEKVSKAFPEVSFFVSDEPRPSDKDPFLAVITDGVFLVIERWNEPSFRM